MLFCSFLFVCCSDIALSLLFSVTWLDWALVPDFFRSQISLDRVAFARTRNNNVIFLFAFFFAILSTSFFMTKFPFSQRAALYTNYFVVFFCCFSKCLKVVFMWQWDEWFYCYLVFFKLHSMKKRGKTLLAIYLN